MRFRPAILSRVTGGLMCLVAGVALATSGVADQHDPRLPSLFEVLREVRTPVEARLVEGQIWAIWMAADDETVNLLMRQGTAAMSAQNLERALEIFTEMVKIAPDFAEGWNKRATVLYLLGAHVESIADIGRTLELEPRHFGALSGLGLCNMELENDEAALDAFERALAINPHMEGVRANAELLRRRIEGKAI